jgi:hypothetical protein
VSLTDWLLAAGAALMVLGLLAMAAAPKGPRRDGTVRAWTDEDEDWVQPWTATLFAGGFALAVVGVAVWALADSYGVGEGVALGWVLGGLALAAGWVAGVYRYTRRGCRNRERSG